MSGDEGIEVQKQGVPAIGGADYRSAHGLPPDVQVVASEHLGDAYRAEGVAYNEVPGVNVDTAPYPQGTAMTDTTPGESIN